MCIAATATAKIADVSAPQPLLKGAESNMYYPVLSEDGRTLTFSDLDRSNVRQLDFESGAVAKITTPAAKSASANRVTTRGSVLYITTNGKTTGYTPVESNAGYLWESLSPDGTKVLFFAAGQGAVVTDLNGNILAKLGNLEAPVWFGNDHIVAQRSTDDGHQYRSSQIVLVKADGTETQELTRPESMTFTPTASVKAGKVVYSTIDGLMYQLEVTLK